MTPLADPLPVDDVWTVLQQPLCASDRDPRLMLLLAALDQGCVVDGPVYARPHWSDTSVQVYHFTLRRRDGSPLWLTVSDSAFLQAFLHTEGVRVVRKTPAGRWPGEGLPH